MNYLQAYGYHLEMENFYILNRLFIRAVLTLRFYNNYYLGVTVIIILELLCPFVSWKLYISIFRMAIVYTVAARRTRTNAQTFGQVVRSTPDPLCAIIIVLIRLITQLKYWF